MSLIQAERGKYEKAQRNLQYLLEDLADLMDPNFCGETDPDVIAARVGYSNRRSLARKLHRHGHHELANVFERVPPDQRKYL